MAKNKSIFKRYLLGTIFGLVIGFLIFLSWQITSRYMDKTLMRKFHYLLERNHLFSLSFDKIQTSPFSKKISLINPSLLINEKKIVADKIELNGFSNTSLSLDIQNFFIDITKMVDVTDDTPLQTSHFRQASPLSHFISLPFKTLLALGYEDIKASLFLKINYESSTKHLSINTKLQGPDLFNLSLEINFTNVLPDLMEKLKEDSFDVMAFSLLKNAGLKDFSFEYHDRSFLKKYISFYRTLHWYIPATPEEEENEKEIFENYLLDMLIQKGMMKDPAEQATYALISFIYNPEFLKITGTSSTALALSEIIEHSENKMQNKIIETGLYILIRAHAYFSTS